MNIFGALLYNRWLKLRLAGKELSEQGQANLRALEGMRPRDRFRDKSFVVVDLETTGLDPYKDRVISVGAVRFQGGRVRLGEMFCELINPGRDIPPDSIKVHAILPDQVAQARPAWDVFEDFLKYLGTDILVAHHARFDLFFLNRVMREQYGFRLQNLVVDTVLMCRAVLIEPDPYGQRKGAKRCSLDTLAELYGLHVPDRHTAMGDALATALILQRLLPELEKAGWRTMADLVKVAGVWG